MEKLCNPIFIKTVDNVMDKYGIKSKQVLSKFIGAGRNRIYTIINGIDGEKNYEYEEEMEKLNDILEKPYEEVIKRLIENTAKEKNEVMKKKMNDVIDKIQSRNNGESELKKDIRSIINVVEKFRAFQEAFVNYMEVIKSITSLDAYADINLENAPYIAVYLDKEIDRKLTEIINMQKKNAHDENDIDNIIINTLISKKGKQYLCDNRYGDIEKIKCDVKGSSISAPKFFEEFRKMNNDIAEYKIDFVKKYMKPVINNIIGLSNEDNIVSDEAIGTIIGMSRRSISNYKDNFKEENYKENDSLKGYKVHEELTELVHNPRDAFMEYYKQYGEDEKSLEGTDIYNQIGLLQIMVNLPSLWENNRELTEIFYELENTDEMDLLHKLINERELVINTEYEKVIERRIKMHPDTLEIINSLSSEYNKMDIINALIDKGYDQYVVCRLEK